MKLQFFLIVMLFTLMNAFINAEESLRDVCEGKMQKGDPCEKSTDCCFTLTNQLSCIAGECGDSLFGR